MTTFILIPGAWRGGWYYEPIVETLRSQGHSAFPVTLTGLGDRAHLRTSTTNLDTHIQDVVSLIEAEDIHDAVLLGHSYSGMVITGVADRLPGRIRRLIYSDSYVPVDGESCFELTSQGFRELFIQGARGDGYSVEPPPGPDTRRTPHPLGSFLQKIRLTGPPKVDRKDYIYLSGWAGTPFTELYERLRHDPDWHVHTLPTAHNIVAEAPEALLRILLEE
ncbi:MAG: hypothetical protein JWN03_1699 [Nocardia sp.]|uniref:alpha/beta fold hydrolase n=1 Tax=Nocardia sp. TaxID=1821 RepID=UPI00263135F8|nr:alpha/beta hydrolase [Nocardia sp.]MCU1641424.1 hypothetical protein [Nocardia sp.]